MDCYFLSFFLFYQCCVALKALVRTRGLPLPDILIMAVWTQINSFPGKRIFIRALGGGETSCYWDLRHNGTANVAMNIELCDLQHSGPPPYHGVIHAWTRLKRRFPLLVAEMRNLGNDKIQFVVREERLGQLVPDEITYKDIASHEEAVAYVLETLQGSPPLWPGLLARVYVLRRTNNERHLDVVIFLAHCITDGCSTNTILRTFCDTLSSSREHPIAPLEDRLAMCLSTESRVRYGAFGHLSIARWRWRCAIGFALRILMNRKLQVCVDDNLRPLIE